MDIDQLLKTAETLKNSLKQVKSFESQVRARLEELPTEEAEKVKSELDKIQCIDSAMANIDQLLTNINATN